MRSRKTTEIRREEILRAALSIVEQQGLDNLNTNAIATVIQLVPSAIYRHFKNKEDLIAALIDFIGERLQQNLQQAAMQEGTALERLKCLFELHVKLLQEEPAIPRILYFLISSERNQELKQKMLAEINAYVYETKKLLLQGKKAGEINQAVDVTAAAMMFLGMIQPLVILSQENKAVLDEYPPKLWQCYQRAIAL